MNLSRSISIEPVFRLLIVVGERLISVGELKWYILCFALFQTTSTYLHCYKKIALDHSLKNSVKAAVSSLSCIIALRQSLRLEEPR